MLKLYLFDFKQILKKVNSYEFLNLSLCLKNVGIFNYYLRLKLFFLAS